MLGLRATGLTRIAAVMLGMLVLPTTVRAQIGSDRYAAIVVEARSGAVLMEASADEPRFPASLTKMMTLYMAFDALRQGRLDVNDRFPVSAAAATMPPSRLGLVAGGSLKVEDAILALVTKSANDAAAALGEYLGGGSELRFAQMMTLRARSLGMRSTTFRNASGLPDLDQVTSARDMAVLGRRLQQDFPGFYGYFAAPSFIHRGRTHWNHNRLLQEYDGTDGIKTGYVNDSGFNLVASAQRDGVRLVAAVFGGSTGRERDRHMMAILDQGFAALGVRPREPVIASPPTLVGRAQAATAALLSPPSRGRKAPVLAGTLRSPGRPTKGPMLAANAYPRGGAGVTRPGNGVGRPVGTVVQAKTATVLAATRAPARAASRPGQRIEQGDGGRRVATTVAAKRPVAAATRPGAAKPPVAVTKRR